MGHLLHLHIVVVSGVEMVVLERHILEPWHLVHVWHVLHSHLLVHAKMIPVLCVLWLLARATHHLEIAIRVHILGIIVEIALNRLVEPEVEFFNLLWVA